MNIFLRMISFIMGKIVGSLENKVVCIWNLYSLIECFLINIVLVRIIELRLKLADYL